VDDVHSTKGHRNHKCRKDGLVVNRVPVDGTVPPRDNRRVSALKLMSGSPTYYVIANRMLKAIRGITPRPTPKVNPFRESDKMKSEYDATKTIGSSSASWASYSKDAWKAKLPIPTTVTPCVQIRG